MPHRHHLALGQEGCLSELGGSKGTGAWLSVVGRAQRRSLFMVLRAPRLWCCPAASPVCVLGRLPPSSPSGFLPVLLDSLGFWLSLFPAGAAWGPPCFFYLGEAPCSGPWGSRALSLLWLAAGDSFARRLERLTAGFCLSFWCPLSSLPCSSPCIALFLCLPFVFLSFPSSCLWFLCPLFAPSSFPSSLFLSRPSCP